MSQEAQAVAATVSSHESERFWIHWRLTTDINCSISTDCEARNVAARRHTLSPAKNRQAAAARLRDMPALFRPAGALEAPRALPHQREAVRVPAMHEMLRTARPAAATSAKATPAGRHIHTTPQCAPGKHDWPPSKPVWSCTQEFRLQQCWRRRQPLTEAARKHHQSHRSERAEQLPRFAQCGPG